MKPTPTTHDVAGNVAITPVTPDRTPPAGPHVTGPARHRRDRAPVRSRAATLPEGAAPSSAPSGSSLAKATVLTTSLTMAGALLGLGRDQFLAHFFGASTATDALLVAWILPDLAATLLIEDGMVIVLVPVFSMALARRARGVTSPDPVQSLIASSLPRLCLILAAVAALFVAGAPLLVSVLAPGLPDPSLAVTCTRLTATCVLSYGVAGYCGAALRAHRSYFAPAMISVVSNSTIIITMFVLGGHWGVRSAALGAALGGCLMAAVQGFALWRRTTHEPRRPSVVDVRDDARPLALGLVAAVLLFSLSRQSQVLVERYFASSLPEGTISHLSYSQKIGQYPVMMALMLSIVTFPVVARAIAEGDLKRARDRIERDLVLVSCIALLGAAAIMACAPQFVELLFQRGAFTPEDTAATAAIVRVFTLGLLGHTLVGALVRSYFSAGRVTWYPLGAMAAGLITTVGIDAWAVGSWGARGIAAGNAAGITLTALILMKGLGGRSVPVRTRRVVTELAKPTGAAAGAAWAGLACAQSFASPLASAAAGAGSVTAVFLLGCWLLDAAGARSLALSASLTVRRSLTRKPRHGR